MMPPDYQDSSLRFLFEKADIRGEWVHLGPALQTVNEAHGYSECVRQLMGQFAAAVVLISNNLKYSGKIVLQARSEGPLSLVMVACTSKSEIRGIARGDTDSIAETPIDLIPNAQLAITIERDGGQRYQGIVPLDGDSLATALDHYFLQSEQLHTRFWLFSDGNVASGLMLQQLPSQIKQDPEDRKKQWQEAEVLAETITADELFDLAPSEVLHRLYHEQSILLFEPQQVEFNCSCSRERSLSALSAIGVDELEEMLTEQPTIDMTCEMCGTSYRFNRSDLLGLAESPILH